MELAMLVSFRTRVILTPCMAAPLASSPRPLMAPYCVDSWAFAKSAPSDRNKTLDRNFKLTDTPPPFRVYCFKELTALKVANPEREEAVAGVCVRRPGG